MPPVYVEFVERICTMPAYLPVLGLAGPRSSMSTRTTVPGSSTVMALTIIIRDWRSRRIINATELTAMRTGQQALWHRSTSPDSPQPSASWGPDDRLKR